MAKRAPKRQDRQLVVFALAGEDYAVPIATVQEIIAYVKPRSVAGEAKGIEGVISLRGKIVPIVNLASRLGVVRDPDAQANIVILETAGKLSGVIVDRVVEVITLPTSALHPVPGGRKDVLEAVAEVGDRLVMLLTAEAIAG
jgi:purine-binding chemotaxis protein CheW